MPGFDVIKFVWHIAVIGVLYSVMTMLFDALIPAYNTIVGAGLASNISFQCMSVLRDSISVYAVTGLLFAGLGAILVANARAETNSPLISVSITGSLVCAVSIMIAILMNYIVTLNLDMWIIPTSTTFFTPTIGTPFEFLGVWVNRIFSVAHIGCVVLALLGYLYMILDSIRRESLQWLYG